jgi:hypothetical protein
VGILEDITLFEKRLNDLVIKYEHYFLGLEKKEPVKLLDEVEYTASNIANTMLTFRYNSLKARLMSYKQYWLRTVRLMEDGRYSRDRFKMEIHEKEFPPESGNGKSERDEEMESIYRQFVQARTECSLPVAGITREIVAEIVEKHKRATMAKYRCTDVELRITVENGNPKLKIRPKK